MIVISGALVLVALVLLVIGLLQHPLGYVYASIAVSLAAFGFLIRGIVQRRGEISGPVGDPGVTPPPTFGAGTPGSNVVTTNPSRGRTEAPEPAEPPADAPNADALDADALNAEPPNTEPPNTEPPNTEPPNTEPPSTEPPSNDAPDPLGPGTSATAATGSVQQPDAEPEPPVEHGLDSATVDELAGSVLIMSGRPRYHVPGCRDLLGTDAAEVDVRDARHEGFTPCGVCRPDQALGHQALDSPTPSSDGAATTPLTRPGDGLAE